MKKIHIFATFMLLNIGLAEASSCYIEVGTLSFRHPVYTTGNGYRFDQSTTEYFFNDIKSLSPKYVQTNNWQACYSLAVYEVSLLPPFKEREYTKPGYRGTQKIEMEVYKREQEKVIVQWVYQRNLFPIKGVVDYIGAELYGEQPQKGVMIFDRSGGKMPMNRPFIYFQRD